MIHRGMLVHLPAGRGIGKLESVADGRCQLSVFYSTLRTESIEAELSQVSRAYLSPQTRVYVRVNERIRIGRVTNYSANENGLVDYEVRFPNGKLDYVNERDLAVRPWSSPEDPAEMLAAGGAETQYLHDRRHRAVTASVSLRGAAQGLTALVSAGIEFVPHQVAAVQRVLTDPVQRYLLADEVGLGKTIEAGLIVRQHLIDNAATRVVVSAPAPLVEQWRTELVGKLRVDQFGNPIHYCSHERLCAAPRSNDILVVDEAHHLVGVEGGEFAEAARALEVMAKSTPTVLLLSATPALGDERKFLSLLNLLDPASHPLGDLEGFRTKLLQRKEIGRVLLGLEASSPGLVLHRRTEQLLKLFPGDQTIAQLAPLLVDAIENAPSELASACAALRDHVAENYRLHQRLIRSRRADAKGWEFRPRGPQAEGVTNLSHVRTEALDGADYQALAARVEDWRFAALESASRDEAETRALVRRYVDLLDAIGAGACALKTWAESASPSFRGAEEIENALLELAERLPDQDRVEVMVESTKRLIKQVRLSSSSAKIVVFASSPDLASAFHLAWDLDEVASLLLTGQSDVAETMVQFNAPRRSSILVTDRRGEEGLNLSVADAIVHLDLPLSAGRIEQRIGRLDRFGRRQEIVRHRILLPWDNEGSPWLGWFELLSEGLSVFNRSISDVQFLMEDLEEEIFTKLFTGDASAPGTFADELRKRIAEERTALDEQYALDRLALNAEGAEKLLAGLERVEESEHALEAATDAWIVEALQFSKTPCRWPDMDPFHLTATVQTLVPRLPWQQQMSRDAEKIAFTWRRRVASKQPEATLLRPGTPLLDVIDRFTRWDDRGTAFVTYRSTPAWIGDDWLGFKLVFVVEPNVQIEHLLAPTLRELAVSRRTQQYLPPHTRTLYVDVNGAVVREPILEELLQRAYQSKPASSLIDTNLGSRLDELYRRIDATSFQNVVRAIRDATRVGIASDPELVAQIADGVGRASADLTRRRERLRQPAAAQGQEEVSLMETVLAAVAQPTIRLDAMGCFIVSHRPLRDNGRA